MFANLQSLFPVISIYVTAILLVEEYLELSDILLHSTPFCYPILVVNMA